MGKNDCENIVFLVAGRIIYRKGHELLLDALETIPEELCYQCRIVGDGPDLGKLKKRCMESEKLLRSVVFTGKIPFAEMEAEYRNADVLVMPSLRETTGSVLLEAMSQGLPVITIGRFGGATLLDQETGWLYDGNSKSDFIQNLAEAMIECISHPHEVKRRGKNALEKAVQYTWAEKDIHYQEVYRSVVTEK